jgi:uncharacterized protein (TIGR01777 family)
MGTDSNCERGTSVLITGGSGLVGRYLTSLLVAEGYSVAHLSRQSTKIGKIRVFKWDPAKNYVYPEALDGIDYLIHLSGANIGEKRWSVSRKREIISSRVDSANMLYRRVSENNYKLKAFITASAVGYYGSLDSERIFKEEDPPSDDFLATTCRLWEETANLFSSLGIRTVSIRSGVVLAKSASVLTRFMSSAKFGLLIRLGSGKQSFPWVHIEDLCDIYLKAIQDQRMEGAYNAVAPEHVNHIDFVRSIAGIIKRPFILLPVPGWIIKAAIGEMSDIVLKGSIISAEKIIRSGYSFRFIKLEDALKNILTG